jgi:ribonuclease VapC
MIVDTSALVAIVRDEPGSEILLQTLSKSTTLRLSAASLLETFMVIDGARLSALSDKLDALLEELGLVVEAVTEAQVIVAREAFGKFGKGSGHPARLNFGDCFAYALSKSLGEPLLFVGNDFSQTDIAPVTY